MSDQTKTVDREPRVRMTVRTPTDPVKRAEELSSVLEEIAFLAAATMGVELRQMAQLASTSNRGHFDAWSTYRPMVAAYRDLFAAHLQRALLDGDGGERDRELERQMAKFPLDLPGWEVSEQEVTMTDGRTVRSLARKPVKPEIKLTVGR